MIDNKYLDIMIRCLHIIIILLFCSCQSRTEQMAWNIARTTQSNSVELTKFLQHYKDLGERQRYKAACFLVANMPNKSYIDPIGRQTVYDVDVVVADSLIASVEYSFGLLDTSPFLKDYSFEDFCEYILPYRIANEPLEYYWKWDCVKRFATQGTSVEELARSINSQIYVRINPENYGEATKAYSSLISEGYGKCDDRATLVVMALRSAGIPAAFEYVPYWGSSNNGHSFCSAILPDGRTLSFQNGDDTGEKIYLARKTPKVLRRIYGSDASSLFVKYKGKEEFAANLARNRYIDVTNKHDLGCRDVEIENLAPSESNIVYLCVYSPRGWVAVDCAQKQGGQAIFRNVGTGVRANGQQALEAESLGDGILYMPCYFAHGETTPAADPIIVSKNGIIRITDDTSQRESMVLERKYPLANRIVAYARNMVGGMFDGANRADFLDAELIHRVEQTPQSRMQRISVSAKPFRYIRYRRPKGVFSIAELRMIGVDGNPITAKPMACDGLNEAPEYNNCFDGDPLTYFELGGGIDIWLGLDLGSAQRLSAIEFAPRNDDNGIAPGNKYELLYFAQGNWQSLGKTTASDYNLKYDGVPRGALLLLCNLTRGHEEHPFTYSNHQQFWW